MQVSVSCRVVSYIWPCDGQEGTGGNEKGRKEYSLLTEVMQVFVNKVTNILNVV